MSMPGKPRPVAVIAADVPARSRQTVYPEPFASRVSGRDKSPLGDLFGLTNFGVNLTRLAPNAQSALRHAHHLVNRSTADVVYLEVGDRTPGEEVAYPDDDIRATNVNGNWEITHKDGSPY